MKSINTLRQFRLIAFLEGWSYLILLFLAMPLKYLFDLSFFVRYVGMAHGVLFVGYMIYLFVCTMYYRWSINKAFILFLISLIPFGTLVWKEKYSV